MKSVQRLETLSLAAAALLVILSPQAATRAGEVFYAQTNRQDIVLAPWAPTATISGVTVTNGGAYAATGTWFYALQPQWELGTGPIGPVGTGTVTSTGQQVRIAWSRVGGATNLIVWRGATSTGLTTYANAGTETNLADYGTNAWSTGAVAYATSTNVPQIYMPIGHVAAAGNAVITKSEAEGIIGQSNLEQRIGAAETALTQRAYANIPLNIVRYTNFVAVPATNTPRGFEYFGPFTAGVTKVVMSAQTWGTYLLGLWALNTNSEAALTTIPGMQFYADTSLTVTGTVNVAAPVWIAIGKGEYPLNPLGDAPSNLVSLLEIHTGVTPADNITNDFGLIRSKFPEPAAPEEPIRKGEYDEQLADLQERIDASAPSVDGIDARGNPVRFSRGWNYQADTNDLVLYYYGVEVARYEGGTEVAPYITAASLVGTSMVLDVATPYGQSVYPQVSLTNEEWTTISTYASTYPDFTDGVIQVSFDASPYTAALFRVMSDSNAVPSSRITFHTAVGADAFVLNGVTGTTWRAAISNQFYWQDAADVVLSSPAVGDVGFYDGTNWINRGQGSLVVGTASNATKFNGLGPSSYILQSTYQDAMSNVMKVVAAPTSSAAAGGIGQIKLSGTNLFIWSQESNAWAQLNGFSIRYSW